VSNAAACGARLQRLAMLVSSDRLLPHLGRASARREGCAAGVSAILLQEAQPGITCCGCRSALVEFLPRPAAVLVRQVAGLAATDLEPLGARARQAQADPGVDLEIVVHPVSPLPLTVLAS